MIKLSRKQLILACCLSLALFSSAAQATTILPTCISDGNCQVMDILSIAGNVADWILGSVGAIALLFFVYGGFTLILSGGNEKHVEEGKLILTNAVIGLVIVFTSYIIVQYSMTLLGVTGFSTKKMMDLPAFFSTFK